MPVQQDIEENSPAQGATAVAVVQSLLTRHGVDKRRYSVKVAEVLNLSRSAAHNRVHGDAQWTWDDVITLGKHFGESLSDMARGVSGGFVKATLHLDKVRISVSVRLGTGEAEPSDTFAAFKKTSGWVVAPQEKIGVGLERVKVLEIIHSQESKPILHVALLDDDKDTLESLAHTLSKAGCNVTTYTNGDNLVSELDTAVFDAFIVDWLLSNKTSDYVLKAIREKSTDAKIVILSGQTGEDGKADDAEVAEAIRGYKARFLTKPINPAILLSSLESV